MSDLTTGRIEQLTEKKIGPTVFVTPEQLEVLQAHEADVSLLRSQNAALTAEVERLKADASKAVCAYCGEVCEKDLFVMGQHAAECEKHPIHEVIYLRSELSRLRRESVRAESLVDWFDRRMNVRIQKLGNPDYTFLKVAEEMYDLLCGIWHRYETPARAQRKEGGQ